MNGGHFPPGTGNTTSPIEECACGWRGPLAGLPHCGYCGRHHPKDFKGKGHKEQCSRPTCGNPALRVNHRNEYVADGKLPAPFCREHWVHFYRSVGIDLPDDTDPYTVEAEDFAPAIQERSASDDALLRIVQRKVAENRARRELGL